MADKWKVTYIKHSGFLVELEDRYLLFDYWQGDLPVLDYRKKLYIFSSHVHRDHYTKNIFKFENLCEEVQYILSFDIRKGSSFWKAAEKVSFLNAGEDRVIDDMEIRTLKSTDEGVAFLVKTNGRSIYHGGDLHWWHWPGDPDDLNEVRRDEYQKQIALLKGEKIDCAFVVLDPRQEEAGGWGMDYFLQHVKSRYVFPMHCWEKYSLIREYKEKNDMKYLQGQIMGITKPEQEFILE